MRNWFLFLPLSAIVASCGLSEVGGAGHKGSGSVIWGDSPGNSSGGGNSIVPVCYMTAADYAEFLKQRRVLMAKKIKDYYYSL